MCEVGSSSVGHMRNEKVCAIKTVTYSIERKEGFHSLNYNGSSCLDVLQKLWFLPATPYNGVIIKSILLAFFFLCRCGPPRAMASSYTRFLDHTQRRTTVGRTSLDEWSARRRDLYLTTRNTHNRQTSMPPAGFEPTISADERPQTYAFDRTATGTGKILIYVVYLCC